MQILEQMKSNNQKYIDQKKRENEQILEELARMGVSIEDDKLGRPKLKREGTEVYKKTQDLDADDRKYL